MIKLPKYMNDVVHMSLQENGVYSSVPYLCWMLSAFAFGSLGDWLIATKRLTVTNARKLFIVLGNKIRHPKKTS